MVQYYYLIWFTVFYRNSTDWNSVCVLNHSVKAKHCCYQGENCERAVYHCHWLTKSSEDDFHTNQKKIILQSDCTENLYQYIYQYQINLNACALHKGICELLREKHSYLNDFS